MSVKAQHPPLPTATTGSRKAVSTLSPSRQLHSARSQILKRGLDLIIASLGLLLVSPVLVLLALVIYFDSPGTVIFRQERSGKGGNPFKMWKFRTMVPNSKEVLEKHLAEHPAAKTEWKRTYKLKDDPRITRAGKVLRKTSLDELPQLFNVLGGQMSLVGPRPLPMYHHRALTLQTQQLREAVLPGLTGLWQITYRSEGELEEIETCDALYVCNWSVGLDLSILLKTIPAVLKRKGAY